MDEENQVVETVGSEPADENNLQEQAEAEETTIITENENLTSDLFNTTEKTIYDVDGVMIEIIHSVTVGDILIFLMLFLLLFGNLLSRIIGGRKI